MNLRDIIEGYFVLRKLKKEGYIEEDNLGFSNFIRLVLQAEKNIKSLQEVKNEEKQG